MRESNGIYRSQPSSVCPRSPLRHQICDTLHARNGSLVDDRVEVGRAASTSGLAPNALVFLHNAECQELTATSSRLIGYLDALYIVVLSAKPVSKPVVYFETCFSQASLQQIDNGW